MRVDEFLLKLSARVSTGAYEAATIEALRPPSSPPTTYWWIGISRNDSNGYADGKQVVRRVATFKVDESGQMTDIKPLNDASVGDWQKVESALR